MSGPLAEQTERVTTDAWNTRKGDGEKGKKEGLEKERFTHIRLEHPSKIPSKKSVSLSKGISELGGAVYRCFRNFSNPLIR